MEDREREGGREGEERYTVAPVILKSIASLHDHWSISSLVVTGLLLVSSIISSMDTHL